MLRLLRRFLVFVYGCEAFGLLLAPILAAIQLSKHSGHAGYGAAISLPNMIGSMLVGAICACAWWTNKYRKASAKEWGIAVSVIHLAAWVVYLFLLPSALWGTVWVMPLVGVLGVIVFLTPSASVVSKIVPIAGDGTSHLLNKFAGIFGVVTVVCGNWWSAHWAYTHGIALSRGARYYPVLLGLLFVVVVMHEIGHAAIGFGMGMQLRRFGAGPFQWTKFEGRWGFKFKPSGLIELGGGVVMAPATSDYDKSGYVAMILAGPAVNLLMAAFALGWVLTADGTDHSGYLGILARFGSLSLCTGLLNLIPFQLKDGSYSDGAQLRQILTEGMYAEFRRVNSLVASSLVTGLRPRDYEIQTITRILDEIEPGNQAMLLALYASSYYIDRGMMAEAGNAYRKVEKIVQECSLDIPAALHTAFVFRSAYLHRNAMASRNWWEAMQAKKAERLNADYWMAHSALHWIEGDMATANESWCKGNAMALELPQAGAYAFDRHLFAILREAMDEAPREVLVEASAPVTEEEGERTYTFANWEARARRYATAPEVLQYQPSSE